MKLIKFIALFLFLSSSVCWANTVSSIEVIGNKRVQSETISSYFDVKVGDEYSSKNLSEALKALYATDLFGDVLINEDNGVITISVVENPIINIISFEGNTRVKDEVLQSEVSLRARSVYTKTRIQSDLERVKEIYEKSGYFSAKISPKVIVLDENRVNVVFEIKEGYRAKIKHINIIGNAIYPDDILKNKLATSESRWYKFLSGNQSFDADRLAYDRELLRRFYLSRGYVDFEVLSTTANITPDKRNFYITIKVDEGERYKLADIAVNALLKNVDNSELETLVSEYTKSGDWYNSDRVENAIANLTTEVENFQYAFAKVTPSIDKDEENKTIALTYNIDEGQKVFIGKINIAGNARTEDEVIRREFEVAEGDAFNRNKLIRSERDLKNLDFFKSVDIDVVEVEDGLTDIDVTVEEKSTGAISMGAGFSTDDGPLADFSISENNFLGKGQKIKLGTVLSGDSQQVDFSFTEPYFLGRDLSAGFDVYNIERDYQDESSYDKKLTGFALRAGYPLSMDMKQKLTYRLESSEITDVGDGASLYIREQEGKETVSSISSQLIYDTRDSALDPTEGTYLTMTNELAGLGGTKYLKNTVGGGFYYPLSDQWVFSNYSEAGNVFGYGGDDASITRRFFIGGKTLRGFESSGIGPRDISSGDALGGENYIKNSAELSFPLGFSEDLGVKGYTFLDAGTLWGLPSDYSGAHDDASIRAAAGIGLAWDSPMGPLKINFALPFMSEEYDKDEVFSFTFGTRF